jgi:hypothetical protein
MKEVLRLGTLAVGILCGGGLAASNAAQAAVKIDY